MKSHRLSETPIVWRNTSDTFTPRGLGYNCASCELVKCFELKDSDGELLQSKWPQASRGICAQEHTAQVFFCDPHIVFAFIVESMIVIYSEFPAQNGRT